MLSTVQKVSKIAVQSRRSKVTSKTEIKTAITYDDVLLVPKYSAVQSRKTVSLKTKLSRNITLNNPIVSSNMDTVTEQAMAIEMARNGGIGIIHRFLSIEEQAEMVKRVKRAESLKVEFPYTCSGDITAEQLSELMELYHVRSILVTDPNNQLQGIVTRRDMRFASANTPVRDFMTPRSKLVVAEPHISVEQAADLLAKNKLEKLPLVNSHNHLCGLYTSKDIINHKLRPYASLDKKGSLLVGAAVGVKAGYLERAERLIDAGCDVLVVDVAHGHTKLAIDATSALKASFPDIDVISGNVCTAEGVRDLVNAGADGIKVGVGPGSICITRIVTGCGIPQLTALLECADEAEKHGVPLIADGGVRYSGDIVKALAAGASTVMLGSALAGTDESPGQTIIKDGKKVKVIRGMAGYGANISDRQRRNLKDDVFDVVPEGVEAVVNYRGAVSGIIKQLVGGISSGLSYCGAFTVPELRENAEMVRITSAGKQESGSHDVKQL
eukprot:TRINITY_DN91_c1_g1_i1.p1 TRINITY_DN91_c1_g1~~TRINITY_DN91_c1_g1_i1.p1  ORF type:complete len:498 (+),score=142.63 TRINITY_DN91_c1_g1_i1:31-1524(+)